jgi:sugar lactone lactonase YvrE
VHPLPNDAAFGPDGSLYVTDSLQAVIFRVRPGGGEPEVWFQVPGFETIQPSEVNIGTNGIAIAPDRKSLVFGVTMSGQHAGTLFRLPLEDHPVLEDLTVFHKYVNQEAPDDMAFARSGRLYIALAGSNEISVLSPNGEELKRYSNVQAVGRDGKTVPFDAPAQPAFVGDLPFLLCTNHAYFTRDPNHYALLGMRVEDVGLRLIYPRDLP